MSFLKEIKTVECAKDYERPTPNKGTWRDRFRPIELWANANPWDDMGGVDEKDVKMCIRELFEAINMSNAAFRFIEKRHCSTEALTAAREVADILEGTT